MPRSTCQPAWRTCLARAEGWFPGHRPVACPTRPLAFRRRANNYIWIYTFPFKFISKVPPNGPGWLEKSWCCWEWVSGFSAFAVNVRKKKKEKAAEQTEGWSTSTLKLYMKAACEPDSFHILILFFSKGWYQSGSLTWTPDSVVIMRQQDQRCLAFLLIIHLCISSICLTACGPPSLPASLNESVNKNSSDHCQELKNRRKRLVTSGRRWSVKTCGHQR